MKNILYTGITSILPKFKKRSKKETITVLAIGGTGVGRVRHPWDYLPPCPHCSSKLWMVHEDKTLWSCGEPKDDVKIYCASCERFVDDDIMETEKD